MYLKKIETQGFKSFANRAVMEFAPGIMGIVGPNGSGKSNVADAVRWVLGEQSARQLRGSNMQDVIFAGTENRRPMSYAFVSLTIDNSDRVLPLEYDEVVISRQVFRSGESEYRLNGNLCRLKDIYEIFYDSGIGKEGYSIIGQGQIDQVLSNKPEERRLMFDEAAGIVRFKKRRDITLKKLESEKSARERAEDILSELEKQVGPLEKQSAKAKTYLRLRDELKEYEVGVFALEAEELDERLKTTRQNLAIVNEDLEKTKQDSEHLKERFDALNEENEALDKWLIQTQGQMADLRVENENREGRIDLLTEQIRAAESNSDLIDERLKDYDHAIERAEKEREDFYRQKNEIDSQIDETDDKITQLEDTEESYQESVKNLEFQIEQGNKAILEALDQKARISGTLASLDTREEENSKRLKDLSEEKSLSERLKEELEGELKRLKKDQAANEENTALLKQRLEEKSNLSADFKDALRRTEENCQHIREQLSVVQSRKDNLNNLIERYEGYGGSVKALMDVRDRFSGIRGVVADLISTEKRYETAVETVLGARIQNIVTETEAHAKEMIVYLKEKRLGRATFLPLDAVREGREISRPEAMKERGALGSAASLVKCQKTYQAVVNFLLGHVLVVDHMDHALAIARKFQYQLSLVTLEGEYLSPGGAISGGSYRNNSNLLGRRRELEEIDKQEKALKRQMEKEEKEIVDMSGLLKRLEEEIASDQEALRESMVQGAGLLALYNSQQGEVGRLLERLKIQDNEMAQLNSDQEELVQKRVGIHQNVSTLEADSESMRKKVTELAVELEQLKSGVQDKSKELEELRLKFANLTQRGDFLLEGVKRCNEDIQRIRREKKELMEGQTSVGDVVKEREEEIAALRKDIENVRQTMGDMEKLYREKESLREEKRQHQQESFDAREALSQRLAELDREVFRLQTAQQRTEEQIEKQAEYLWNEYEMTPSQARAARNPEIVNSHEVRRAIAQRKKEIKELGPVYVDAIEKYKEVSERYEFLRVQRDDLVKAEGELSAMIKELEKGMREQFKEQFALIQQEFSRVFSDLFAGGKGSIILENEEDVLSSGVIINVHPPGKKLQNMMQLSGGEKALTAIALLFAIQNLKPSPFCLLDEIEAALDEPNVKRFADYLYRLRNSTQFLIITHRRGTMEMADRLYGITMQEKGVSTLVSVNLKDPESKAILDEE